RTSASMTTGSRKRRPPCTTRCATASTSAGALANESSETLSPSSLTACSFRLVEPALTTRMSATLSRTLLRSELEAYAVRELPVRHLSLRQVSCALESFARLEQVGGEITRGEVDA